MIALVPARVRSGPELRRGNPHLSSFSGRRRLFDVALSMHSVAAYGWPKQAAHSVRSVVPRRGHEVSVYVGGEADRRMTERVRDGLERYVACKHQRRGGVPKLVGRPLAEAKVTRQLLHGSEQTARVIGRADRVRQDKPDLLPFAAPSRPKCKLLTRLPRPLGAELLNHRGRKMESPTRA